ncbi:MAG: hypothetical protein ABW004_07725, partial [Aeromicrobium sp.]
TLAGACIYLGTLSAIVSIRAAAMVSTWNGGNRADEFDVVLDALRDSGLSQSGAETTYKVLLTVVAVLAACGAVFAIFTARGDRASRIGTTISVVAAGLAAFLGLVGGGFLFSMIGALLVVFSSRLWMGEIRTYFRTLAGHPAPPPKEPRNGRTAAADPFAQAPVRSVEQAAPTAQPGPPPANQYAPPTPAQYGPPGHYAQQPWPPARASFPKPVSIAVWTAFIGSVVVAGVSALGLLTLGLIGNDYEQMMRDSPFSDSLLERTDMSYDQLFRSSLTIFGVCLLLSLGGLAASILVLVKKRSGDVFLLVMAVVTIVASLLFIPVGLPWTAAAIVCLVHLRKPESRAWFSRT